MIALKTEKCLYVSKFIHKILSPRVSKLHYQNCSKPYLKKEKKLVACIFFKVSVEYLCAVFYKFLKIIFNFFCYFCHPCCFCYHGI